MELVGSAITWSIHTCLVAQKELAEAQENLQEVIKEAQELQEKYQKLERTCIGALLDFTTFWFM